MIAGSRVARSRFGVVHVALRDGPREVVSTLCGDVVVNPERRRLRGPECASCFADERDARRMGITL